MLPVTADAAAGAELVPVTSTKIVAKIKGDRVIINDAYEILLGQPVPEFTHAYADAYEAAQKDNKNQACLAYVVKNHFAARLDIIQALLNRDAPGLSTVRSYGVADWVDQTQRLVVIVTRPPGAPLLTSSMPKRPPLSEELLRKAIIRPICTGLQTLTQYGFAHGAICAERVYSHAMDGTDTVLGDCVTAVCGALQPTLYETIERAMADPLAKGEGIPPDDIYALGVLVAVLLRGSDPLAGRTDRQILEEKISRTTFMVMTDGLPLTPRMSDFFRATLSDDARLRWTAEQLDGWLNGTRAPLKQYGLEKKATRALDFNGQKYLRARSLALDLYDNQAEAVQMIESGHLVKWLDRSLIHPAMIEAVNNAINRANYNGKAGAYEDRLLCYVSMALDPSAPIRYKNVRALPHGLGALLLHAMTNDQPVQAIAEIIREKIAWFWLENTELPIADAKEWNKRFDSLSKVILRRNLDYGLERCLYDLTPTAPCISPVLKNFYVLDCQQVLQALNALGEGKDRPQTVIDRHMAAFVSSRDSKDNASLINLLESEDPRKRAMSLLLLLQNLQKRFQAPQLPGLLAWMLKDAELIAQRFHNLKFRRDVVKALNNEAKHGNFTRIMQIIDNPHDIMRDRAGFENAAHHYKNLGDEHARVTHQLKHNTTFGRETGRQIAAIVSAILAAIFIAGSVIMRFTAQGDF